MPGFTHLHVASGYSMRYGTSRPEVLVQRAAELGQDALALTDRDGAYGAVAFALACRDAGISPILGVDLAVAPLQDPAGSPRRAATPARGGVAVDAGHPRVVLLARGAPGWASLSRVISSAHLSGERGRPLLRREVLAEHTRGLVALLGPDSDVGRALARRRPDEAAHLLAGWQEVLGAEVRIEIVSHRSGARGDHATLSSSFAGRMLGFAASVGVPAVLTNAVRHLTPAQAPVVDVLDAIRRLVPLDPRHLDRANAQGYLKSAQEMRAIAEEVAAAAGVGMVGARRLLAATAELADSARMDPAADMGIGSVHVPELDVLFPAGAPGLEGAEVRSAPAEAQARMADRVLRHRCQAVLESRYTTLRSHRAASERLEQELATIATLGYAGYFLTVAEVVDLIRGMGIRVAARGSGAGSLVNYLLGISGVDPMRARPAHGALPLPAAPGAARHRHRRRVRAAHRDLRPGSSSGSAASACACVSMMDTYRVRHAIRDVGAALGLPPGGDRRVRQGVPAHPGPRRPRGAARPARAAQPAAGPAGRAAGGSTCFLDLVESLDGLPRHVALHPCGVLLSDATLLDRTPVEASCAGLPDEPVRQGRRRGPRAAQARRARHPDAVGDGARPRRDRAGRRASRRRRSTRCRSTTRTPTTLIRSTHTLGCFQIESPGQRELIGKFAPETFDDLIIDISLFRPGPVKSDMVTAVPARAAGLERSRSTCTPTCEPVLRADRRRRGLPRAGDAIIAVDHRLLAGRGRRGRGARSAPRRARPRCARGSTRGAAAGATTSTSSSGSGTCCARSPPSASARPTPRRSRCPPTSRPG